MEHLMIRTTATTVNLWVQLHRLLIEVEKVALLITCFYGPSATAGT
jgi:hypothetical protein